MKILIVSNRWVGNFKRPGYLVDLLCRVWRESGHEIEYVLDTESAVEADIAFLHVDLTDLPVEYKRLVRDCPVVINGCADSIAKDLYSEYLVTPDDSYDGKVIVKTKNNTGGTPELKTQKKSHQIADKYKRKLIRLSPKGSTLSNTLWRSIHSLNSKAYPVFNGIEDVPTGVWENDKLFVQRYLPEHDEKGRNLVRHWYFFGDKESQETLISRQAIVKRPDSKEAYEHLESQMQTMKIGRAQVPRKLREIRRSLGLDYGRIDWVMFEGEPVIFDVNKTPVVESLPSNEVELGGVRGDILRQYAMGIEDFSENQNL